MPQRSININCPCPMAPNGDDGGIVVMVILDSLDEGKGWVGGTMTGGSPSADAGPLTVALA